MFGLLVIVVPKQQTADVTDFLSFFWLLTYTFAWRSTLPLLGGVGTCTRHGWHGEIIGATVRGRVACAKDTPACLRALPMLHLVPLRGSQWSRGIHGAVDCRWRHTTSLMFIRAGPPGH